MRNSGGLGRKLLKSCYFNHICLVRKVGTIKAEMLHNIRLRQFAPSQRQPHVNITPQERKSEPEMSIKHDAVYARAWESDYERPFFDADCNNTAPLDPPEIAVRSDIPFEEKWNTSATSRECSPEIFPQWTDYVM